jgi:hypothetical protein
MTSLLQWLWEAVRDVFGPRLLLLALFFVVTGAGVVVAKLRRPTMRSWPMVEAAVVSAEAHGAEGDLGTIWSCKLSYSYSVQGEFHGGYCEFLAVREDEADHLVHSFRGRTILIHYSPKDPAKSAVLREDQLMQLPLR